jgi:hypothetical protein
LPPPTANSTSELFTASRGAFKTVRENGGLVSDDALRRLESAVKNLKNSDGFPERITERSTPRAFDVRENILSDIKQSGGSGLDLDNVIELRDFAKNNALSPDPNDARVSRAIMEEIDDFLDSIGDADVIGGDPKVVAASLKEGRELWRRARNTEKIEEIIDKAERGVQTNATERITVEDKIRKGLNSQILDNKRARRTFNAEELGAIRAAVKGGSLVRALQKVGRFAPRGLASGAFNVGMTTLNPAIGVPLWLASETGKRGASLLRQKDIARVLDTVRTGGLLGP